jgi:hypothetical protein
MKSLFAVVAALAIAGFLFYFLLRSSAVPAPKVAQPQHKETVAPPPDAPKKTDKK